MSRHPDRRLPDARQHHEPGPSMWEQFSANPRLNSNRNVRASDADRDVATDLIGEAYADGRLDAQEHDERISRAMAVRTMGEFVPLLEDLRPSRARTPEPPTQVAARISVQGWVGLAILFNLIWLFTCLTAGHLLYYWPMWPMLGTAVPVIGALVVNRSAGPDRREGRELPRGH